MKNTILLFLAFMVFFGLQVNGQWSVTTINTDFPFIENFDTWGTGTDAFPVNWSRPIINSATSISYPSCVSSQKVSLPNSLMFRSSTTTPTYAVTPAFAEDIHNLHVSFSLKAESMTNSGVFQVGVMSNPNDTSTFELVQTITPSSLSWIYYEIIFDSTMLSGANNFIAFKHVTNNDMWFYWLDDVAIDLISSCQNPIDLSVDNITLTSAKLSWTESGIATSWNLKLSTSPINPSVDSGQIELAMMTNSYTIPAGTLNPSTTYYWYIQSDCGDDVLSYWSEGVFNTQCGSVSFPYSENFIGVPILSLPNCWTSSHAHWSVKETTNAAGIPPELELNWGPSITGDLKVFLPIMDATASSNLEMTFLHKVDWYSNSFDLRVDYSIDNGTTWAPAWQAANVTADVGPALVSVDLSSFVDGEVFQLSFVFSGLTYDINRWNIDNIIISGTSLLVIDQIDINSDVADISVCRGTSESSAIETLAPQITITDTEATEYLVTVTWAISSYVGSTSGVYNAVGTFELPSPVTQTTPTTILKVYATVTVTNDELPEVTCPADFAVTEEGIVTLSGGLPAGGTYSGSGVSNNKFDSSSLVDGDYTITYTHTDVTSGCSNSCEFTITVAIVSGINENGTAKIGVYPNPNKGVFNISFSNINDKVNYQIIDTKGSIITDQVVYTNGNTIEEVSINLVPGVYFVKVITANQTYVEKLVIQ